MIVEILLLAMCLIALLEKDKYRGIAISIFAIEKAYCYLCVSIFDDYFFKISGFTYYILMAIFDFIVILTLCNLTLIPKVVILLQRICLISIITNMTAWTCWTFYISHAEIYNLFYLLLYCISIILMIKKESKNDRYLELDIWTCVFRFNDSKSANNY